MTLFPFENTKIVSPLSKGEIANAIKNNVEWNTQLGLSFNKDSIRDYEGFVENNTFKIRRILRSGINSFVPTVSGIIYNKGNGSNVELKLRLHRLVIIFAIIITVFSGSLFIVPILNKPTQNDQLKEVLDGEVIKETLAQEEYQNLVHTTEPQSLNWNSFLLLIMPYLLCTIFFNYEAKVVKGKLTTILKAKENIH